MELCDSELAKMSANSRRFIKKARELKRLLQERIAFLKEKEKDDELNPSREIWLIRLEGSLQTLEDAEHLDYEIDYNGV